MPTVLLQSSYIITFLYVLTRFKTFHNKMEINKHNKYAITRICNTIWYSEQSLLKKDTNSLEKRYQCSTHTYTLPPSQQKLGRNQLLHGRWRKEVPQMLVYIYQITQNQTPAFTAVTFSHKFCVRISIASKWSLNNVRKNVHTFNAKI
jgi:hypothetical protein